MIWKGMQGLLESKKGTLCLIILGLSTWALMTKHLEGAYFAAIIGSLAAIYNFVQHRLDMAGYPYPSPPPYPNLGINPAIGTPDAPTNMQAGVINEQPKA